MSRCTFHDLHHEKAPDTQHIRLISEGGCSLARNPGPVCIDSIQVSQTCTTESQHTVYRAARGPCAMLDMPENSLFSIPSEFAPELDLEVLPELLRSRFTQQGIELSAHPAIKVQREGRLWVICDGNETFPVRKLAAHLAVFRGNPSACIAK